MKDIKPRWVLPLLLILTLTISAAGQSSQPPAYLGLQVQSDSHSQFGLFKKQRAAVFSIHGYYPGSISNYSNAMTQEIEFDSLDAFVLIRKKVRDSDIVTPVALSFDEYLVVLYDRQMKNYWQDYSVANFSETTDLAGGPGGINFEIPVKIKSKTFQKIFGSGSVGLIVTGDIRIQAGLRREDRSETRTAVTRGSNTNFKMQQTQRFSVTGKIGDKVKVNVDQDSERAFDFDNNVRLVYEGYDDEIVRRFEAGNISLSLPGTRYVTFSGKNSGLFGLKTEMVLGNLNLTAIASQEKGESQKLSLSGGAKSGGTKIDDYRYVKDQYFFLDEDYRLNYRYFTNLGDHITSLDPATGQENGIKQNRLEVYIASPGNETRDPDKVIEGRATLTGIVDNATFSAIPGEAAQGQFVRLDKSEYEVSNELGYIRLRTPLTEADILAVAYERADSDTTNPATSKIFGDLDFVRDATDTQTISLKLIRDQSPLPTHETWNLSWKHVYYMGTQNIQEEGLEVDMYDKPSSGQPNPTDENGVNWLTVFGLDTKDEVGGFSPDGKFDIDNNTFIPALGELHFRDLQPFDPVGRYVIQTYPSSHDDAALPDPLPSLDEDRRVTEIYNQTDQSIIRGASEFFIDVKTQNRSSEYDLGFNVIEGSEVVELDGSVLQKGRDYTIDYFSGRLTILNQKATNPSSQLDITYERNQLFQLEKKTILGMRAEYDLGGNSFLGGTFLYLSESTLDQKVRVGRGPMRNMVWDLNTRLNFKPNFIGKFVDAIPMVRSQGETILNVEGEIAQVLPNPNTLNNPRTGDTKGVAYIDDFEAAKKAINLGVLRRNWNLASQPADDIHTFRNKVSNFVWYNPVGQIPIEQIYPERDVSITTAGGQNATHILTLDMFDPQDQTGGPGKSAGQWAGVMRALSPGFYDQSQTKFVEIMVQGDVGRLHIDLGTITEDVIPNGRLDTEDKKVGGTRNGTLDIDQNEDVGIDGVDLNDPPRLSFARKIPAGQDSSAAAVPYDFWDVNQDGFKNHDEPWSYDDWFYPELSSQYLTEGGGSINGTETSQNDEGGRLPDTEDINDNGILDPVNQYFSFSFSLDPNHPDYDKFFVPGSGNPDAPGGAWKLYRIPFNADAADYLVGSPTTNLIQSVRIWVDELQFENPLPPFPSFSTVSIAEINLVGSEWKEVGVTANEYNLGVGLRPPEETGDIFAVTQINNHENPFYDTQIDSIGVAGAVDKVTNIEAREQSLVLKATNLAAGEAGVAQKSLFQGESYIHYDRLKMFVYGADNFGTHISSDTTYLEYFVRFGANRDNYYEYRSLVYPRWDQVRGRNEMDIDLLTFTSIDRAAADTVQADSAVGGVFYDSKNDIFIRRLENSKSVAVKGNPSFTNVRILTIGIRNNHPMGRPFLGEVWFNELRLSNIEQDRGMAMRARGDLRIGKFGSVNIEVEKRQADFHNVAQRFGTGNNSTNQNLNASLNLEQMLPQSFGIAMPLTFNFRNSTSNPKYFPGLDRRVTSADLNSPEILDRIETVTEQTGFNISFRRQAKSKNFFVRNTLDGMSLSLGRSQNTQKSPTVAHSINTNWTGNFDYRLDFGRNNYVSLFSWLPDLPLIRNAKDTKFYYSPQNVSVRVSGDKTYSERSNRIQNTTATADTNITDSFILDRSVRANMKVFENLSLDFNRAHKAQMRDSESLSDFFSFGNDIGVTQAFSARYSPRIFSWLNNNASYSTNYRFNNNLQNRETGRSASNTTTFSTDVTFQWKTLVNSIFGKGKSGGGRGQGTRRGRSRQEPDRETEDVGKFTHFQQAKPEGKGLSFNPLNLVKGFFGSFKDIQFNYSQNKDVRQSGLDSLDLPSARFQFGLDSDTGVESVENLSGTPITSSDRDNYSVSTGMALGRSVDVSLRYQKNIQSSFSSQQTGSESNSYLSEFGMMIPFPDWTVRVSGLNKLPLFNKLFKTVSLSHAYSGSKDFSWSGVDTNGVSENITSSFRPFAKLDFTFKNGLSTNIQVNKSTTTNTSLAFGSGANRTRNFDINITANYSKRSGFSLPFWPFNKKKLKNSVDLSVTFTASSVVQENTQNALAGNFQEANKTTRWSFSPKLTYSFSSTVRGGAFLEIGKTESKKVGTTKIQEFGIDVNIAIRGN